MVQLKIKFYILAYVRMRVGHFKLIACFLHFEKTAGAP